MTVVAASGEPPSQDNPSAQRSFPSDGGEWIELFVQEMMNASNMDDARSRACRALEVLEKSIVGRAAAEATENIILVFFIRCFLMFQLIYPVSF